MKCLNSRIAELERLVARRNCLQDYIQITEGIIQGDSPIEPGELASLFRGTALDDLILRTEPQPETPSEERLWKIAQTVLQMHKRPMTAAEVLTEIDKTDRGAVQGEHRRESVRSAMSRKPDVFERVGRGLFVLKEWPERLKSLRDHEPIEDEAA